MLFILFLLITLSLIILFLKRKSNYWKKKGIAQVDGVLLKFILGNRSISEIYTDIYNDHPNESYIGTVLGIKPALIIKDVRDIRTVMQGNFESFHNRGIVSNPNDTLSDNILFMDDYRRWKLMRHKLSPVFTSMKIKNMFYIMERCARDLVKFVNSKQFIPENTYDALYIYTTASVGASIFGIDTHTENTMDSPFLKMTREALDPSLFNNLKFSFISLLPFLSNILNVKRFGAHEDFFIGTFKRVMELRRNAEDKRHDFIDTCLELQKEGTMRDSATGYEIEASDEILAAQAFFFFLAGVDTSATVMHFTLLELASNQNILEKVHKEIDKVFGDCNEKLTYEDLEKLEYLEMVINEAMRKYPPVGSIRRICTKATVLPVGQVRVEKGDTLIIPVYALHRDEKYHLNPNVFDPERFAPDNVSKIVKFSYLPFGEGNRMCIGARFGRLQVKSGLAWLLQRFTLKEQKYEPESFAPSFFSIKDPKANFKLISRT